LRRQGVRGPAGSRDDLPIKLSELEAWAIQAAFARAGGNKSRAANLLGISRDTLYRKLHRLEEPDRRILSDSQTPSKRLYRKK
jgi:DNA-binding NtrC family response regulator